jgi:hypothetical protein
VAPAAAGEDEAQDPKTAPEVQEKHVAAGRPAFESDAVDVDESGRETETKDSRLPMPPIFRSVVEVDDEPDGPADFPVCEHVVAVDSDESDEEEKAVTLV